MLSALRHADRDLGDRATLLKADTYTDALERFDRPVLVHEPTSHAAEKFVHRLRKQGLVADILPTPTFALPRKDFQEWAGERTRFRMEDFYRDQRRRFDVLMDGSRPRRQPVELRRGQPRTAAEEAVDPRTCPHRTGRARTTSTSRSARDLDEMDLDTVGVDGPRLFAVTPAEAKRALSRFIEHRLPAFGRYEDAIMGDDWAMSHSLLSVPLNLGVLHPLDAVRGRRSAPTATTQARWPPSRASSGRSSAGANTCGTCTGTSAPTTPTTTNSRRTTPLPDWWTDLDADAVTAECLHHALEGVRDRGWTHHIQRLMVLGNHALQRGYRPDELTDWFATAFVDGFRWVMPTNVVGMSQHADGGLLATKPYTSGGAYINKMSDHCGDCEFDPKKRVGDDACPFTAGYWAFIHRHRDLLAKNNRTQRVVATMDRLKDLDAVLEQESARDRF